MRTNQGVAEDGPEVRERILDAALQTFAELGFDGSTTRQIASRAGVPLGLLRYYFGGKQQLWQAAVDRAFEEMRSALDFQGDLRPAKAQTDDDAPPIDLVEAARKGIRAQVQYVAKHPEFVRLMHEEGKRRGPRMRWLVDKHVKPIFALLLPLIRGLQEIGRLPKDIPPIHFAYALIGSIDVIFHQAEECRRLTGVDPADPEQVEAHARAVEFMFLGGSGSKSP